jgi:hypothetical protein
MTEPRDPRPLEPREYWEDEPDEPSCRLCGSPILSHNEERRGLCDPCYEAEQEEDEETLDDSP